MGALWYLDLCGLVAWGCWLVHRHWPSDPDRDFAHKHRIDR